MKSVSHALWAPKCGSLRNPKPSLHVHSRQYLQVQTLSRVVLSHICPSETHSHLGKQPLGFSDETMGKKFRRHVVTQLGFMYVTQVS